MKPRMVLVALLLVMCAGSAFSRQEAPVKSGYKGIILFFESDGELKPEEKTILRDAFVEREIKSAMDLLASGPSLQSPTLPRNAKVQTVFIDANKTAYLNFNENLVSEHPGGITREIVTVASVCKTVFNNFAVDGVMILSGGKELKTLAGTVDIESVINRGQCDRLAGYRKE